VAPLSKEAGLLAAVVSLSEIIAKGLEAGESPEAIAEGLDEALLTRLSLEKADALWRIEACKDLPAQCDQVI